MAKWGEGDPRWIVEERPDATNVNNWHWTEKNATPWSKDRLQKLFQDMKIEKDGIVCSIDEMDKCNGEATANNRKGKLIFFYEWELVLKWSGRLPNSTSEGDHKGKITIPNLSEENELDEVEITVTIDESNNESENLKQFMYNVGRGSIREKLGVYIKELKEEYSKNLILPKKGEDSNTNIPKSKEAISQTTLSAANRNYKSENVAKEENCGDKKQKYNVGCKLEVRTLSMQEEFHCNANDLYNALTRADMLTAFTHAPAKVDAVRGGEFVLYSGNVLGKFEDLIPEKRIVLAWRLKNWPSGHYSNVLIDLEELNDGTMLKLKQTGIPASEYDAMKVNWNRYYWHSIKQTFGFGATIPL